MLNNDGETVAKYRKLHLFDLEIPGIAKVKESDFTAPGNKLYPPLDTPLGKIGLATVRGVSNAGGGGGGRAFPKIK